MRTTRILRAAMAGVLAATLGLGVAATAVADDIDDRRAAAEAQARAKKAEREELQNDLEHSNAKLSQAVLALNEVEGRLPLAEAELAAAQAKLEKARREAEILAQRLQDAQDEEASVTAQIQAGAGQVDAARADIVQMAREAARGKGEVSALGLVTGAQSTEEFLQSYAVTSSAARSQARTLTELQDAEAVARNQQARLEAIRQTIGQLKKAADDNVVVARSAQQQAQQRKSEVEGLIAQQRRLKAEVEAERATALQEIEQNKKEQAAVEADIKQLIQQQKQRDAEIAARRAQEAAAAAAAREQANAGSGSGGGSGSTSGGGSGGGGGGSAGGGGGGGGGSSSRSFLGWPTDSRVVTSHYGMRLSPTYGVWMLHAGSDFRAGYGAPIYAAQDGEVDASYCADGPGCNVRINHGSYNGQNVRTRYLHLANNGRAQVGQWVRKGQIIGYSGGTGRITGPHLHFEVYVNGSSTNPVAWLP
ncbi:peptidase M23 [Xylanimonas oleitrophica]|uniref:Peptidase M23 n=1 Tax=Xylanimonas oleitrophica TaxID=2607479 RepID=A0A2W5XWW5_9MICO|nr:M23 family metallopeptidase [Xylanimonas oleitrophica]PZR55138.1 peptidase M23 [Xylanimonas oleitrophica]